MCYSWLPLLCKDQTTPLIYIYILHDSCDFAIDFVSFVYDVSAGKLAAEAPGHRLHKRVARVQALPFPRQQRAGLKLVEPYEEPELKGVEVRVQHISQTRPVWDCHRTADQARGGFGGQCRRIRGVFGFESLENQFFFSCRSSPCNPKDDAGGKRMFSTTRASRKCVLFFFVG